MPILFLLLLSIIDFGFGFGDYIGVRNGVREGARLAVVNAPGAASCTVAGSPNAATKNIICLTKDRIGLNAADTKVSIAFEDGSPAAGEWVRICASYPAKSRSGFTSAFLNGRFIKSNTQMRLEETPSFSSFVEGGLGC